MLKIEPNVGVYCVRPFFVIMVNQPTVPVIQLDLRPNMLEFGWGHPPLDLLPVEAMQRAAAATLARHRGAALTYGNEAGPGTLIEWLAARIGQQEGITPAADELLITGGNSHALDQILTLCTKPGDTVLVESPTYHLAVRILRDHPVRLVAIPTDQEGLVVDALAERLADLRRTGVRPRLLYTIPTFHNPTGHCLSLARRQVLVELAANTNLLLVEDDVYRELAYDEPAPPSLWSLAPAQVIRMGSFSKSLAPGLRLGWLTAERRRIAQFVQGGLLDSGGGINHFTALVVAELCANGDFDRQVARLCAAYRTQRDTFLAALSEHLPAGASWQRPGGGFFVWVTLSAGLDSATLLPNAEREGVSFLPGTRFFLDGQKSNALRLAFSLYPPVDLREGARRLGRVLCEVLRTT
jgi:2-aminoadipate transaminase